MGVAGIYKISSPTGKVYIGQSWDIKDRWYSHKHPNKKNKGHIAESVRKHGAESHLFEIIHKLPNDVSQVVMNNYEQLYLSQYIETGYKMLNLRGDITCLGKHWEETKVKIGNIGRGRKHTDDFKKSVGDFHRGRKRPIETGIKISESLKGKLFSDERKINLSKAQTGVKRCEEYKKRQSEKMKGIGNPFFGRKHSEETRAKISATKKLQSCTK